MQEEKSLGKYLKIKKEKQSEMVNMSKLKEFNDKKREATSYLSTLVPNVFQHFEKHYRSDKIKWHKNYTMYNADRAVALKEKWMEWRTNFKTPLTRIFTDSLFNRLFDSNFSIDVYSTTPKGSKEYTDGRKPKDSVNALNEWCYLTSEIDSHMKLSMKDWVTTGDWFRRVDMRTAEELSHFIAESWKEWKPYSKWIPLSECTAIIEYIPWEEIIYEAKKDFYESSFVWWRRIEPHEKFIDRRWYLLELSPEVEKYIYNTKNAKPLFSKDYSKFRRIKDFEDQLLHNHYGLIENDLYTIDTEDIKDHGESYEHWTSDTLTIMRNWHIVYDGPNPLWINMHPFVHFWLGTTPNVWCNTWVTQLLMGIQELYDLVYNGYADFLKRHFNPMYMATGWQWIEWFDTWYLDREPYKIIKNLWDGKVEKVDLGDDIGNWFAMLDQLWNIASQISWVTRYTGAGAGEWVERSARWSDYQVQITLEVLKPIVFAIGKALNRTSKIWCELAKTKLPPKCIVSIMGKDGAEVFKKISLDDLANDYVIKYKSDSISDYLRQREIDNLNSFLNYEKVLWTDPVTNTFIFDQRKIAEKVAELHWLEWSVLTKEKFAELQVSRAKAIRDAQQEIMSQVPQPQTEQTEIDWGTPNPVVENDNTTYDEGGYTIQPEIVDETAI